MRYLFKGNLLERTAESLLTLRASNEILIRYRVPGRFKLLVPPLLYAANASYRLKNEIGELSGITLFDIDEQLGTLTVHYDENTHSEKKLFLILDGLLTPMLAKSSDKEFGALMAKQRKMKLKNALFNVGVVVTTVYIVYIHSKLLIFWILSPLSHWAPLLAVIFLIWAHRQPVRRGLGMSAT